MVSQPQKRASSFCEMLCRQRCSPPMYSMIWHKLCKCQVECQFKLNEKTVYLRVFVAPVERVILAWWMPGSKGLQYNYCNPPALEFKRATLPSDYCKPKFEPLLVMTTHEQSLAVDCCYPTSKKKCRSLICVKSHYNSLHQETRMIQLQCIIVVQDIASSWSEKHLVCDWFPCTRVAQAQILPVTLLLCFDVALHLPIPLTLQF